MNLQDRFRGCLTGLAVGDALGTTLEFLSPGAFEPIDDMVGGGPFHLKPGQWTDDTSLALCLAESLLHCQGFDPIDQLERYVRWWRQGHWSSTGHCFDIGNATRKSLHRFEVTRQPWCTDPNAAGNGSLMRLAPVPMYYAADPRTAMERAGESSGTTHGATAAIDSCRYFGGLIAGALQGASKEELLSPRYCPVSGYWEHRPLTEEVDEIAQGSFKTRNPPKITGSGYVVRTLEAALWALHLTDSFRDGCLRVVNLGDDADTTGAVFGQLAGALYGAAAIPSKWMQQLHAADAIRSMADDLLARSLSQS